MDLILQRKLPHQQRALDVIGKALDGVNISAPRQFYENPIINLTDPKLTANIQEIQKSIPAEYRSSNPIDGCINLEIKMETGERVIIVIGCINALISRVSETLTKYNSCIA